VRSTATNSTYTIDALGLRVAFSGPRRYLAATKLLFPRAGRARPLSSGEPITLQIEESPTGSGHCRVTMDGSLVTATSGDAEVLPLLESAVAQAVIDRVQGRYFLFHAAAVAYQGHGLLMPGASGSGKSTLAGALVAAGCQYLSDEIAALDPESLRLTLYPKSVCAKEGGYQALASGWPGRATPTPQLRANGERIWYLAPPATSWARTPVPVRHVVLPRFVLGADVSIARIPRATGLSQLIEQTFAPGPREAWGVARLVEMLRQANCWELRFGDTPQAAALLLATIADHSDTDRRRSSDGR
jgi:hypothetical protein